MPSKPQTWKRVTAQRREQNFVGRAEHINEIEKNFSEDVPSYMLFSITGEGGVGKSTLLKRISEIVQEKYNAIVITCNDRHISPVICMGRIAEELAKLGYKDDSFDDRYKKYRDLCRKIESDPNASRGVVSAVVKGLTDITIKSVRRVPGIGPFADYIDEKAAGDYMAELTQYFSRSGNDEDTQLIREPDKKLTPLFMNLINQVTEKKRLVLIFDVFEQTQDLLSLWLLSICQWEYGDFNTWLTFIISGRDPLEQHWTALGEFLLHMPLEPFTQDETKIFLSNRGINDETLANLIFADTRGLPVLIELLVGTSPNPNMPLPDISKDAVDRFLQWTNNENHRRAALLASIPRQFNQDILITLLGEDSSQQFTWLASQSYIRRDTHRGWYYHEKVRELMLRYQNSSGPGEVSAAHYRLVDYFSGLQANLNLEVRDSYQSENWRNLELERIYHLFSAAPERNFYEVFQSFMSAFYYRWNFAEEIARQIKLVTVENSLKSSEARASDLVSLISAFSKNDFEQALLLISSLKSTLPHNKTQILTAILNLQGEANRLLKKNETAIECFNSSLSLDSNQMWTIARRGETYRMMNRFEEALADFNQVIANDGKNIWAINSRGETFRVLGKFNEAITDLSLAIHLEDKNAFALGSRGAAYRQLGKYGEALEDLNRAVEIDPTNTWDLINRGITYRLMEKYQEALDDLNKAIEINEKNDWALSERGETYRVLGKYDEALIDFTKAISFEDKNTWSIASRGQTYSSMGLYEKAIEDFNRAIELDQKLSWAISGRGQCYYAMHRYEEALADFTQVIGFDEKNSWAIECRGEIYFSMNKLDEALADYSRSIALDNTSSFSFSGRGETYRLLEKYEEALEDLNQAILLDNHDAWAYGRRAKTFAALDKFDEALIDINKAIELDDQSSWLYTAREEIINFLVDRAENNRKNNKLEEALNDFTKVLEQENSYAWALASRGQTYHSLLRYDEALADLNRAIELNDELTWAIAERGEIFHKLGLFENSLSDLNRVIERDENYAWAIRCRAETYQRMRLFEESFTDLERLLMSNDEDSNAYILRGENYRLLGKFEESINDFSKAISLGTSTSFVLTRRAASYYAIGKRDEADLDLKAVLSLECNNEFDYYHSSIAFILSDRVREALIELEKAFNDVDFQVYARSDDLIDPIRGNPDFQVLIDKRL